MTVYLVERELPGSTLQQIISMQQALIIACGRLAASEASLRYVRTTWVPGEARCMCLFQALGPESVRAANELARAPFSRIVEAVDLRP